MCKYDPITDAKTLQYSTNDVQVMLEKQRQRCADDMRKKYDEVTDVLIHTNERREEFAQTCLNATGEKK